MDSDSGAPRFSPALEEAIQLHHKASYDYGFFRTMPYEKKGWRYCSFREHFAAEERLRQAIADELHVHDLETPMTPHAWEIENDTGCRWAVWNREDADAEADEGHSVTPLYFDRVRAALTPSDVDMLRVIRTEMEQPPMLRVFPEKVAMAELLLRLTDSLPKGAP